MYCSYGYRVLLAIFCSALQWYRSSVEPGFSYNRQDEIVSLVRQLTLEVCSKISFFFAHLYCSFQLERQYKQQEAAGERIRCSFSSDRKSYTDKKRVRIRQLIKFLCFYYAFMWENSHIRALFSWRAGTAALRTWTIQRAGNVCLVLCSNTFMGKSSFFPRIFSFGNARQPPLHLIVVFH